MPSFYIPDLDDKQSLVTITGYEFHHLTHVLRCKAGCEVRLNSGKGWTAKGVVTSIDRATARIDVTEAFFSHEHKTRFAIAFSLLKSRNDELVVEKVTELGVSALYPVTTVNSVRNPSANTLKKFQTTAVRAIKQCDNPWLPELHDIQTLEQFLKAIRKTNYIPVTASENRPDFWIDNLDSGYDYCFIIGPEGGFDYKEIESFSENQIISVSISSNILRAETAAVAIAAQYNLLRK